MTSQDSLGFEPLYPDALGAIAGELRFDLGDLQAAVGVFPRGAYYNQPIEIVVILQSMIDRPLEARVEVIVPPKDKHGERIKLAALKGAAAQVLGAGEVGVLRLPVVPMLPTPPNPALPLEVSIKVRSKGGSSIRPPMGGAPPSVLAVSPFKLQALRDVEFSDPASDKLGDNIVVVFEVASKELPPPRGPLKPTYETLWTQDYMREERKHISAHLDHARLLAGNFSRREVYEPLMHMTSDVYALHGLALHPGEAMAIAKMLTYTLSDRSDSDPTFRMGDQRWFQVLAQTLASDEKVARWSAGELIERYLYESTIYDATLLGFTLIRPKVRTNLGDRAERIAYANKLMRWLAGQLEPDLVYVYLPLVLGGVVVNHLVTGADDDPWGLLEELHEAYRGRIRLADDSTQEIFDMLDKLLLVGEDDLRRARITRS